MPLLRPFPGLRPVAGRAVDVIAPPYDVMSTDEARAMVQGRPYSFLHISRPEVDLPLDTDPYAPEVYAKAAENLRRMRAERILEQDQTPSYYVYRLTMGEHVQTGLVAVASVTAYGQDRIKKHELTRPIKEDDRVCQIEALNAQTGPVLLAYPKQPQIDAMLAEVAATTPEVDVQAADKVRHQIWVLSDPFRLQTLTGLFDELGELYIADGHHRSAAASRVAAKRRSGAAKVGEDQAQDYFLAVAFPQDQMQILAYNRLVRDLHGQTKTEFLDRLGLRFQITCLNQPGPLERTGEFGMYLGGEWYRLRLDPGRIPWDDPVSRLDVSLLANELIEPLLGIRDQRRDDRIDFVGGIRGLAELQRRVDTGDWAVAFALRPTSMEDLMAVADAGDIMPPKSTWFEPKLADGLVSHLLD